jgi:hypothetical protein
VTNPQRVAKDEPERIVLSNINEYGWHCVHVIEDDGVLCLAGLFTPLRYAILLRLRTGRHFLCRRSSHATHPCVRPATASQAREPDSPHGLRPSAHPWAKERP